MADATFGFCSTHATASWAIDRPRSSAIGRSACTLVSTSSRMQREIMFAPPLSSVAREPAGGALARLVLAGQHALRDRRQHDLADALPLAGRHHLRLDDPPQHRVLRLVGDQRHVQLTGQGGAPGDLVGGPLGDADVEHLALPGPGRRTRGTSPPAASSGRSGAPGRGRRSRSAAGAASASSRLDDVLAAQAAVVRAGAGRPEDLGEDLQALPALAVQRARRAPTRRGCRRRRRRCRTW